MENSNWNFNQIQQPQATEQPVAKTFIASVFSWMGIALAISAVTAYVFGNDMSYLSYLIHMETGGLTGLGYVVMFAPLGFVLLMGLGYNKLSATALSGLFLVYAVIMGMSLSFIFLMYTAGSIYSVFIASAFVAPRWVKSRVWVSCPAVPFIGISVTRNPWSREFSGVARRVSSTVQKRSWSRRQLWLISLPRQYCSGARICVRGYSPRWPRSNRRQWP